MSIYCGRAPVECVCVGGGGGVNVGVGVQWATSVCGASCVS